MAGADYFRKSGARAVDARKMRPARIIGGAIMKRLGVITAPMARPGAPTNRALSRALRRGLRDAFIRTGIAPTPTSAIIQMVNSVDPDERGNASTEKPQQDGLADMDLDLAGKNVVITGGTRGIGRAIVDRLAKEGASIALCARTADAVEETVASLKAAGVRAFGSALDVRDSKAFAIWFEAAVGQLGGLDIAISNVSTRPTQQGEAGWREAFETDFLQHVRMSDLALPHLCQGRAPALLFVSSIASILTVLPPGEDGYGTMKAALISLTGQLAAKHGSKGVRVNAVSPGPILFPGGVWDEIRTAHPALFERAAQLSALGRHGRPQEVADAVAFLVSPRASYITGANLRIDGAAVKAVNF